MHLMLSLDALISVVLLGLTQKKLPKSIKIDTFNQETKKTESKKRKASQIVIFNLI